jgi:hypothetical protein
LTAVTGEKFELLINKTSFMFPPLFSPAIPPACPLDALTLLLTDNMLLILPSFIPARPPIIPVVPVTLLSCKINRSTRPPDPICEKIPILPGFGVAIAAFEPVLGNGFGKFMFLIARTTGLSGSKEPSKP